MANVDPWTQALLVTPLTICGVALRPYSLAHHVVLRAKHSPYVTGGIANRQDLFFALQVCARSLAQIRTELLGTRPPVWRLFFSGLRWRRASFETADASFRTYLSDFRRYPERNQTDGKSSIAAPFEWHAARILCSEYGYTLDNVWDVAMSASVCAVDAWAEARGDKGLMSEYDKQLASVMQRMEAAEKAGESADPYLAELQALIRENGGGQ